MLGIARYRYHPTPNAGHEKKGYATLDKCFQLTESLRRYNGSPFKLHCKQSISIKRNYQGAR